MRLGIQLYTVRTLLEKDIPTTLRQIKEAGIHHVEMAGFYGATLEDWAGWLAEIGLTPTAAHEGIDSIEDETDRVAHHAKTLGYTSIVIPWISKEVWSEGWAKFAKRAEKAAEKLQPYGLSLAYHNHDFEFELENGVPGLDIFYTNSDPTLVKAQLDLAWIRQGGQDPAAYVEKYANRIDSVHLKDTKLVGHHEDCIAGTGDVDWISALAATKKAGVKTGSVEMDNAPGDVMESVAACAAFFHSREVK